MSKDNLQVHSDQALTTKENWLTDRAWLSGIFVLAIVIGSALWLSQSSGFSFGKLEFINSPVDNALFILVAVVVATSVFESVRVFLFDRKQYFCKSKDLQQKRYARFFLHCIIKYIELIALIFLVMLFYKTAGEYGYNRQAPFYQIWFRLLDIIWLACIWLGLPYIIMTRAFHAQEKQDIESFSLVSLLSGGNPLQNTPIFLRHVALRLIFAPLACVFFADNFTALVDGLEYIGNALSTSAEQRPYRLETFNQDLIRISMALLLCLHMALAVCGYISMSRWQKNTIQSSDTSFTGWIVCLLCYPPFSMAIAWYFVLPGERDFLNLHSDLLATTISVPLILLFVIYLSATVCFGTRFSNLTHRGIIRTGPYRWVRHPAYAVYVCGLWLAGLPIIISELHPGSLAVAVNRLIALIAYTWIYYLRAITEEKHLSADPTYRAYCEQTSRRFIPDISRKRSA